MKIKIKIKAEKNNQLMLLQKNNLKDFVHQQKQIATKQMLAKKSTVIISVFVSRKVRQMERKAIYVHAQEKCETISW